MQPRLSHAVVLLIGVLISAAIPLEVMAAKAKPGATAGSGASAVAVTPELAKETLRRATTAMRTLATHGGYVYLYDPKSPTRRTAERPATMTQIAIQAPGTPSVGLAFLRAYEATHDPVHLDAARDVADALMACQLGSGGWNRTADFDPARPNVDGARYDTQPDSKLTHVQILQHTIYTTYDDDTTQCAVRFLLAFHQSQKGSKDPRDVKAKASLDRALEGMLKAQFPNGAWPQRYGGEDRDPAKYPVIQAHVPKDYPRQHVDADYTRFYTNNDNCHAECIQAMLLAHRVLGDAKYLEAARRGADFFLLAQLPEPQPAWAQQYGFDMVPAWARRHEMPSVSSMESSNVVGALIDIYLELGDPKYFDAAERAVAWLERVRLPNGQWSRLYELGTDRPVYGDDRGGIYYTIGELQKKYQTSYGWESTFKIPDVLARFHELKRLGRDAYQAAHATPKPDPASLKANAAEGIATLDPQGRWIASDRWQKGEPNEPFVSTKAFIRNVEALADYLATPAR